VRSEPEPPGRLQLSGAWGVAGTSVVEKGKRGLASGFMNTSAQVGTALKLATLLTLAATRTAALSDRAESAAETLVAGYRLAFLAAAGVASLGVAALYFFRQTKKLEPGT
jgi:hypothetical protein